MSMFWFHRHAEETPEFDPQIPTLPPSGMDMHDPQYSKITANQDALMFELSQNAAFLNRLQNGAQIRQVHEYNLGSLALSFEAYEAHVWSVLDEMKQAKIISGEKPMTQSERMPFFTGCKFRSALIFWAWDIKKIARVNELAGVYHVIWQGNPLEWGGE